MARSVVQAYTRAVAKLDVGPASGTLTLDQATEAATYYEHALADLGDTDPVLADAYRDSLLLARELAGALTRLAAAAELATIA